jgi:hypothetical protein
MAVSRINKYARLRWTQDHFAAFSVNVAIGPRRRSDVASGDGQRIGMQQDVTQTQAKGSRLFKLAQWIDSVG